MKEYGVHSKFDIDKHKERFCNYLEVLITEDGEIQYAVPSHQLKAEDLCCDKLHISRQELEALCPEEYYLDYMNWLLQQCGAIALWNDFFMGVPNQKQLTQLKRLKLAGLYRGTLKPQYA